MVSTFRFTSPSQPDKVIDTRAQTVVDNDELFHDLQKELRDAHAVTLQSIREVTESFMTKHFRSQSNALRKQASLQVMNNLSGSAIRHYHNKGVSCRI